MNKGLAKNILILLFLLLTVFSSLLFVSSLKQKYDLWLGLTQAKQQIKTLEREKENFLEVIVVEKKLREKITQENQGLKQDIEADRKKIEQLFADYIQAQKSLEQLEAKVTAQEAALIQEQERAAQATTTPAANTASVKELKEAMQELKMQIRKVSFEIREKCTDEDLSQGNRGFMKKKE